MKCPACKNSLRQKNAAGLTLDLCYGGCGGIWFDAAELERVSVNVPAATTLHSIWQTIPSHAQHTEPRMCPRCEGQVLDRKWFSDSKKVEIDQCPKCGGIWLDAGEFTRIYEEVKVNRETSPLWARAMSEAAVVVKEQPGESGATSAA